MIARIRIPTLCLILTLRAWQALIEATTGDINQQLLSAVAQPLRAKAQGQLMPARHCNSLPKTTCAIPNAGRNCNNHGTGSSSRCGPARIALARAPPGRDALAPDRRFRAPSGSEPYFQLACAVLSAHRALAHESSSGASSMPHAKKQARVFHPPVDRCRFARQFRAGAIRKRSSSPPKPRARALRGVCRICAQTCTKASSR